MTNVQHGEGWELHRAECLAHLATLADDSVDVVITDPPYDEHTHAAGRRGSMGLRDATTGRKASINCNRGLGFAALTSIQMKAAAEHYARLARRWSLIFCTLEMVGDSEKDGGHGWRAAIERAGLEYVRTCVWHKLGSTPQFTGDRPAQAVEAIVCAHRPGRKRWNAGGKHGYYAHPIVLNRGASEARVHTTQKPLSLMRELVADFSDSGELVLDSYAGSATTGVACRQLGRRFHGVEVAACAQCPAPAEWHCEWTEKREQMAAYFCDAHKKGTAVKDNMFDAAVRRMRGEGAKLNPAQPGLFDARAS